jgi:HTH-type transcriptional regulator/antitoxin HigA
MDIKPAKTETDYLAALREIEGSMGAKLDSPKGDRLDALVTLVEAYEAKHHPIDPPDPVDAIGFHAEQSERDPTGGARAR